MHFDHVSRACSQATELFLSHHCPFGPALRTLATQPSPLEHPLVSVQERYKIGQLEESSSITELWARRPLQLAFWRGLRAPRAFEEVAVLAQEAQLPLVAPHFLAELVACAMLSLAVGA